LATGSISPSALSLAGHTAPKIYPYSNCCNTTFQNYDDIIERSCQAWNEILSENGFIKNLCSREWSFLV
jgi:hypothetical protein